MKVFGADNASLPIVDATERGLKYLSKSAGENALYNLVRGWNNLHVTLQQCTDLALNEKSEKAYLYVNPVYAYVNSGKKKTKKLIGYLVAKDDLHFEAENLGGDAGMATYLKARKKKIRNGILIGAGVLCIAAIILTIVLL